MLFYRSKTYYGVQEAYGGYKNHGLVKRSVCQHTVTKGELTTSQYKNKLLHLEVFSCT